MNSQNIGTKTNNNPRPNMALQHSRLALGASLGALGIGLAEIAKDLTFLGANAIGNGLLDQALILGVQQQKLACALAEQQPTIEFAVLAACEQRRTTILKLENAHGDDLGLVFQSSACLERLADEPNTHCLVFMRPSPASQLRLARQLLGERFGITTAESEILSMMVRGVPPHQIASTRRTSSETIRSQIKNMCAKTGSHGQVGLVAFGAAVAAAPELIEV